VRHSFAALKPDVKATCLVWSHVLAGDDNIMGSVLEIPVADRERGCDLAWTINIAGSNDTIGMFHTIAAAG
jgi:hypothetical protein